MIPMVTLTRLVVSGAQCECCAGRAVICAQHDEQFRYFCGMHVAEALRPLRLARKSAL